MEANIILIMRDVQRATLAARDATGMPSIATRADGGRLQVILCTYDKRGKATIDPLSGWVAPSVALETLAQITADRGFR